MSTVQPCPANHPSVWKASEIGGKEGLIHRLGKDHLDALEEMLRTVGEVPAPSITRGAFRSAAIDDLMKAALDIVLNGRGAVILSGYDVEGRSLAAFERVYWFLGTFFGRAVEQSGKHDVLGYVRHVTDSKARGYMSDMELGPHTDYHEILSLGCYSKATSGGESGLASALAVHNVLHAERPDLLAALYEGYYNGLPYRYGVNDERSTRRVPVYSSTDDKVSVFTLSFMRDAAAQRGEPLPETLVEAMGAMREIARREDIQARFMLEPGEMMFWSNRINFHSRTRFENKPGHERVLLRLWIEPDEGRPVHPEVSGCGEMVEHFHRLGLDQRELSVA